MIVYDRLWETMASKGITQYRLVVNGISHSTLARLKNNQTINTETINKLCSILDCNVEDVLEYRKEQST